MLLVMSRVKTSPTVSFNVYNIDIDYNVDIDIDLSIDVNTLTMAKK